ncbi:MAG: RNA-binding protein, partial [Betaproteobacteria bacterium]|nr:RNA-binding protein [Betaproteobacteria bacterium]
MTEPVRLSKRMAELGLASRREADAWIERGWVRVGGAVATLGHKVPADLAAAQIAVHASARSDQGGKVTVLLHKPVGYVSGQAEDGHAPAVVLVQAATRWAECRAPQRFERAQLRGLAPAGRLDIDSTGLLVL